jgi:hypothetical protein
VLWSPARLARHSASPGLWSEEVTHVHQPVIVRQNPSGDSPQGQRRTQRPARLAAEERTQRLERTHHGRLEKARRGAVRPWAERG